MSPLPVDETTAARFARGVIHFLNTRETDPDKCHPSPNIDLCEKPAAASKSSEIVIGTLAGLLVFSTLATLTFLHIRRQRRDAKEFPKSIQELDDYGLAPPSPSHAPSKPKSAYQKPSVDAVDDHDSPPKHRRGDSLQNLARSLRGNPDAYRSRPDDTSHDMKPVEPLSQL